MLMSPSPTWPVVWEDIMKQVCFSRAKKIAVIQRFIFLQVTTVQNCAEIAAQLLSLHLLA